MKVKEGSPGFRRSSPMSTCSRPRAAIRCRDGSRTASRRGSDKKARPLDGTGSGPILACMRQAGNTGRHLFAQSRGAADPGAPGTVRGFRVNTSANAIENLLSKSRSENPSPQKDRRRAKRHRMGLPARFRIYLPSSPDHSSEDISAQVVDLSSTGIGLLADGVEHRGMHIMHPWPATSEQCLLEIKILAGGRPLVLHGKAAWYSQNRDKNPFGFRIGVELLPLTAELKNSIRELIALKAGGKNVSSAEPDESGCLL